jgi:hypothetical protein
VTAAAGPRSSARPWSRRSFPGGVRSRRGPRGGPAFLGLVPGEPGAEDCTDRQARPRRSTPACIWTAWS